jgi:hypothetical protein
MHPDCSSPFTQKLNTEFYLEPAQSSVYHHTLLFIIILILSSHLHLREPKRSFPLMISYQIFVWNYISLIHATTSIHVILDLLLLWFMSMGVEYFSGEWPPTGLFFIPKVLYEIRWSVTMTKFPFMSDSRTHTLLFWFLPVWSLTL